MRTQKWLAFVLILGVGLALSGCDAVNPFTAEETLSESYEVSASPRIIVETFNGEIDVTGSPDTQVNVYAVKRGSGATAADAEADLKNVEVSLTQEGDTIRVIARRTDNAFTLNNSGAEFRLDVPTGASLELRTSNGAITVEGVTGGVFADTSNGALDVSGGRGRLDLHTSNGAIRIEAEEASVNAGTSNGRVTFNGGLVEGEHTFDTSNGSIEIRLPAGARFRIDARTSNGKVSSEFPLTTIRSQSDDELRGEVGENPAVSIRAGTSNGSIQLRRGE